jgi:predicted small lipoprotein YifL
MKTAWRTRLALALLAPVLAACGGGLYIGFGDDDFGPPSVSLAAAQTSVQAGETIRVVAAAADENGIDEVAFYRIDGNSALRLGSDGSAPYEWNLVVPDDGRTTLRLFARATDGWGERADSNELVLTVVP